MVKFKHMQNITDRLICNRPGVINKKKTSLLKKVSFRINLTEPCNTMYHNATQKECNLIGMILCKSMWGKTKNLSTFSQ